MGTKRVYIAAPYAGRGEEVAENIHLAVLVADELIYRTTNWTPFVPHLFHLWHLISPHPSAFWAGMDKDWLRACDALVRIGGESSGADIDMEDAISLGLPVFLSLGEFVEWTKEG